MICQLAFGQVQYYFMGALGSDSDAIDCINVTNACSNNARLVETYWNYTPGWYISYIAGRIARLNSL